MDYILDIENLLLEQVNCVNNINTKLEYVIVVLLNLSIPIPANSLTGTIINFNFFH